MRSICDKRVLTFGTFDHLHPGHIAYLTEAQNRGALFVIVARDVTVRTIKGHMPSESEDDRIAAVRRTFPDAVTVLGDAEDYLKPVRNIRPDLILMGYDQSLPPGIAESDLPCPVERAQPFAPQQHKSSFQRPS